MNHHIQKLILPVAGLGKRLRPLTNRTPKALVPLHGKPLLSYMLEEADLSGIREVVIVVSPQHRDHFTRYVRKYHSRFPGIKKIHVRVQREPLGDGHALLEALHVIKNEPVAVRFSDDVVLAKKPVLASLIELYEKYERPVLLLERVPWARVSSYGIAALEANRTKHLGDGKLHHVQTLVEKPQRERAPSNLAIVGGYIITPHMIKNLEKMFKRIKEKKNDALRLIAGFQTELKAGRSVHGFEFQGERLDCGTLEGFYSAERAIEQHEKKARPIKAPRVRALEFLEIRQ